MFDLLRAYPVLLVVVLVLSGLLILLVLLNWRNWHKGEVTINFGFASFKVPLKRAQPIPPAPKPAENYIIPDEERAQQMLAWLSPGKRLLLHGPDGSGKTSFAAHLAQQIHKRDPWRVLWVNVEDRNAAQVRSLIASLVDADLTTESDPIALKNRLNEVLARRHYTVFLIDVPETFFAQLKEVMPPESCSALVTSIQRDAPEVQEKIEMPSLSVAKALRIFGQGDQRLIDLVTRELEAANELWELCDRQPQLLQLAGARFASQVRHKFLNPNTPLKQFTAHERQVLAGAGEDHNKTHACFELSYKELSEADRRHFRWLGVFSSRLGFTEESASHLWRVRTANTVDILSRLMDVHLIQRVDDIEFGSGAVSQANSRYRLRHYAVTYARAKLKEQGEAEAAHAALADYLAGLFQNHYRDDPTTAPDVFLELEHLCQAARWAKEEQRGEALGRLAVTARNWVVMLGEVSEWREWLAAAHDMDVKDDILRARVKIELGQYRLSHHKHVEALALLEQAHDITAAHGDTFWQAVSLNNIAEVWAADWDNRNRDKALACYKRAIALFREVREQLGEPGPKSGSWVGSLLGEGNALHGIGGILLALDRYDEAEMSHRTALERYGEAENEWGSANALMGLNAVRFVRKDLTGAWQYAEQSLRKAEKLGYGEGEANGHKALGDVHAFRGEVESANDHFDKAWPYFENQKRKVDLASIHLSRAEMARRFPGCGIDAEVECRKALQVCPGNFAGVLCEAHLTLGKVLLERRNAEARNEFERALGYSSKSGNRSGEAGTLAGLSRVALLGGESGVAAQLAEKARSIRREIDDVYGEGEDHEDAARLLLALGRTAEALAESQVAEQMYVRLAEVSLHTRIRELQVRGG